MKNRTLILTAGFGDGHNAAAYALAAGFSEFAGESAEVCDLFELTSPQMNSALKFAYRTTITFLPSVWAALYHSTADGWLAKETAGWLTGLQRALNTTIKQYRPERIISTYPVYPQLLREIYSQASSPDRPDRALTVVTDSITVHPSWFRGHADGYFVADSRTAAILANRGYAPAERVFPFGFPTSPQLAKALANAHPEPPTSPVPSAPLRLLMFPTRSRQDVTEQLEEVAKIASLRPVLLTLVLGRHEKRLRPAVESTLAESQQLAATTTVHGWFPDAWSLMLEHDILIAKAGGATIHEALATRIPCLIDKVVPGQEEGNAALVRQIGGGVVAAPGRQGFAHALRRLLDPAAESPQAPYFSQCRAALVRHDSAGATRMIIEECLRPHRRAADRPSPAAAPLSHLIAS